MLFLTAGLGVGFQVGLHVVWPTHSWRILGLAATATALIFAAVTATTALLGLPWEQAVLLGALASLWGPFTGVPEFGRRTALLLAVLGTGCALVALGGALVWLETGAAGWVGRVGLSLVVGGGLGLGLRLLGRFATPSATIVSGLVGAFFLAALALEVLGLLALPCGLVAGLVQNKQQSRRVRLLLHRGRAGGLHALFSHSWEPRSISARCGRPRSGLYEAALVLVTVPLLLLGLVPMAYLPLPGPHPGRRIGWRLLPRGALLFELFCSPHGLAPYVGAEGLLAQAVLLDILVSTLLFSVLGIARRCGSFRGGKRPAPQQTAQQPELSHCSFVSDWADSYL